MPTTSLRKLLDLKVWQACNPSPIANAANMWTVGSDGPDQLIYTVSSGTAIYVYDPYEDAWGLLPSPALATFAAGTCGRWHPAGPTGTATAGALTTLTTNLTIPADLSKRAGLAFKIRITAGTGAGQEREIASNTRGANSVITVGIAWSVTPDATSVYVLMTGRIWIFGGGTLAAASFKYWDYATQTWSGNRSISGLGASFGTDGRMRATSFWPTYNATTALSGFDNGTAASGSATTIVKTAAGWTVNQWTNSQVRIVAGTNAGKVSVISSNTATTLTFATMTTPCDATSVFVIEGNDDALYLMGNAAVTLFKYSISGDSWATLSPGAARAGAPGAGASLTWVCGVTQDDWSNTAAIKNGRYLYSFRSTNVLDYYDIAGNTWVSGVAYSRQNETVAASGSSWEYTGGDYLYCALPAVSAQPTRYLRFDFRGPIMEAFSTNVFPSPTAATMGDKLNSVVFGDGVGSPLVFLYANANGGTQLHRTMIW